MDPLRRKTLQTLGSAALFLAAAPLRAQQEPPHEGFEYFDLPRPLPAEIPGKIQVLEFFWYGCPHCYVFEPILAQWVKTQPDDVVFRRIPAVLHEEWVPQAKLYYTLEALGVVDRLHETVFNAIHVLKQPLATPAEIGEFLAAHGVNAYAFAEAWNAFSMPNRIQRSGRLQAAYKIDGVPEMGIDGLFTTASSMMPDGRHEAVPRVLDFLVDEARKRRKTAIV